MANPIEPKTHELLGQLGPIQIGVEKLLEAIVYDDEDEGEQLTEEDSHAVAASREYFRQGGEGLSFEQVVAECGFTMEQVRGSKSN